MQETQKLLPAEASPQPKYVLAVAVAEPAPSEASPESTPHNTLDEQQGLAEVAPAVAQRRRWLGARIMDRLFHRSSGPETHIQAEAPAQQPSIDTGTPAMRELRAQNQHTVESRIEDTFGKPFMQRMTEIRQGLFKSIDNV